MNKPQPKPQFTNPVANDEFLKKWWAAKIKSANKVVKR